MQRIVASHIKLEKIVAYINLLSILCFLDNEVFPKKLYVKKYHINYFSQSKI